MRCTISAVERRRLKFVQLRQVRAEHTDVRKKNLSSTFYISVVYVTCRTIDFRRGRDV